MMFYLFVKMLSARQFHQTLKELKLILSFVKDSQSKWKYWFFLLHCWVLNPCARTGILHRKMLAEMLSPEQNRHSYKVKVFRRPTDKEQVLFRRYSYCRVERRNAFTVSRGSYYVSQCIGLLIEEQKELLHAWIYQDCRCEECMDTMFLLMDV